MKKCMWWAMTLLSGVVLVNAYSRTAWAADAMPTDEKTMMMQMQKYGTPGTNHQVLQQAVGKWTHTVRSWMKPGDKPMESQGTSENTMVLGGRFLQQQAHGSMNGQPFEGLGYTGYDNVRGEYQSMWMDSMGTGMMIGTGSYDPASKTIQESGHFSCPMTGEKAMWYRSEWKIIDNDNQVFSMYGKGPDGKEFKGMEIVYKRVK